MKTISKIELHPTVLPRKKRVAAYARVSKETERLLHSVDGRGELLLTIMSSIAQEEARSISENCTWGQRKRF